MIILIGIILYIVYADYLRKQKAAESTVDDPTGGANLSATGNNTLANFVKNSPTPNRQRLYVFGGMFVGLYSITYGWLHYGWYRLYKRNDFHWFDDRQEWNQMDKVSHVFAGYFETVWAYEVLRWAGLDNKRAAYTAAFVGMGFSSSVEIWDGRSAKWGASWSDLVANGVGVSLALSQYLLWEEQRIMCKYSYKEGTYPSGELADRADQLFGKTFIERTIKDYNNMTLWLSINPSKFSSKAKPNWLCYSVGYSANNLYGGFENKWIDKDGKEHDRTDLPRERILKFSLDADLPRLRENDPVGKAIFKPLNVFKMPFPSVKVKI